MNSSNLINPILGRHYTAWHRWIQISMMCGGLVLTVLLVITMRCYWNFYILQKKAVVLQKNHSFIVSQTHETMSKKKNGIEEKIEKLKEWHQPYFYYNHIAAIADTIPADVLLTQLSIDENRITLAGQTQSIESLLGFLHSLDQMHLFQSMNIVELTPSSDNCPEKYLVNFIIKGKLKSISCNHL